MLVVKEQIETPFLFLHLFPVLHCSSFSVPLHRLTLSKVSDWIVKGPRLVGVVLMRVYGVVLVFDSLVGGSWRDVSARCYTDAGGYI